MSELSKAVGKNIKKYRKLRGLSQESLSEQIGIQPRQMSKLETGIHLPSGKTIESICAILDIKPSDLFNLEYMPCSRSGLLEGTYNLSDYRVLKNENEYQLLNREDKTRDILTTKSSNCIEERFREISYRTKTTLCVEYYENNRYANTIIYYPDGSCKIFDAENNTLVNKLLKEIIKISKDINKLEFIQLAINALDNADVIPELELMLRGLKLAKK